MFIFFFLMILRPPISTLFPYTTLFRSCAFCFLLPCFTARTERRWEKLRDALAHIKIKQPAAPLPRVPVRSEEHTSELQSPVHLVCRLLLEKKKVVPDAAASSYHERCKV